MAYINFESQANGTACVHYPVQSQQEATETTRRAAVVTWFPRISYGFPMIFSGFSLIAIDFYWFSTNYITNPATGNYQHSLTEECDFYGFLWIFMDFSRFWWNINTSWRLTRLPVDVLSYELKPFEATFGDSQGYSWIDLISGKPVDLTRALEDPI